MSDISKRALLIMEAVGNLGEAIDYALNAAESKSVFLDRKPSIWKQWI
jgi:hypothetical protein